MSPHQQAEAITTDPVLVELITTAIQETSNETLERGRKRTAEVQAALQAALEDLAKVKQERDHIAGKLAGCKECGGSGYVGGYAHDGPLDGTICNHGNVLAAHDRKVAAGVLREFRRTMSARQTWCIVADNCTDMAEQYERGEREVPGE